MIDLNIKFYTKKEADEIIKKYPDRRLKKKQFIIELVDDPLAPGQAKKAKCMYLIFEDIKYKTAYYNKCFKEVRVSFEGSGAGTRIFTDNLKED